MDENKKTFRERIAAHAWLVYEVLVGMQTVSGLALLVIDQETAFVRSLPGSLAHALALPYIPVGALCVRMDAFRYADYLVVSEIIFAVSVAIVYALLLLPLPWVLRRAAACPFRWRALGWPGLAQGALLAVYALVTVWITLRVEWFW